MATRYAKWRAGWNHTPIKTRLDTLTRHRDLDDGTCARTDRQPAWVVEAVARHNTRLAARQARTLADVERQVPAGRRWPHRAAVILGRYGYAAHPERIRQVAHYTNASTQAVTGPDGAPAVQFALPRRFVCEYTRFARLLVIVGVGEECGPIRQRVVLLSESPVHHHAGGYAVATYLDNEHGFAALHRGTLLRAEGEEPILVHGTPGTANNTRLRLDRSREADKIVAWLRDLPEARWMQAVALLGIGAQDCRLGGISEACARLYLGDYQDLYDTGANVATILAAVHKTANGGGGVGKLAPGDSALEKFREMVYLTIHRRMVRGGILDDLDTDA